jgi:hypothetical protein
MERQILGIGPSVLPLFYIPSPFFSFFYAVDETQGIIHAKNMLYHTTPTWILFFGGARV